MRNNVRELRELARWSQETLGGKLSVSRQTIISIERGHYLPSLKLAIRIARLFEKSVEEVFILDVDDREPAGDAAQ